MKIRVQLSVDVNAVTGLLQKIRTTNWKFDFDILILHVKNGPDIFLTVTGEYKPSCFGVPVETLCRTDRPMCEYNQTELKALVNKLLYNYIVYSLYILIIIKILYVLDE